ncbi:MAG: nucleotidyltransferase domain-containing protein [Oscillospiraceae bacterium]|nr:nucleotidyltransferase domain-containing protein [Oscillospiraceae bacterium]
MESFTSFLYNKNPLLVLSHLSKNVYQENTATSVSKELGLALSSVHTILKNFEKYGIVTSRLLGKNVIYELDKNNPLLKQFRIFDNISSLIPIVKEIKEFAREIILFGSCATGEDTVKSDIDLFVLTDEEEKILEVLRGIEIGSELNSNVRQINPIIQNTLGFMQFKKEEKAFFDEIMKGIVLWEVRA